MGPGGAGRQDCRRGGTLTYAYDALGRRTSTVGSPTYVRDSYFDGRNVVEEYANDASPSTLLSVCAWSPQGRLILQDKRASDPSGQSGKGRLWAMADAEGSTIAVAQDGGGILRRYRYDQDGRTTILNALFQWVSPDAADNLKFEFLYHAQRFETLTQVYAFGSAGGAPASGLYLAADGVWYNPATGRSLQPLDAGLGGKPTEWGAGAIAGLSVAGMVINAGEKRDAADYAMKHPSETYERAVNATSDFIAQGMIERGDASRGLRAIWDGLGYELGSGTGLKQLGEAWKGVDLDAQRLLTTEERWTRAFEGFSSLAFTAAGFVASYSNALSSGRFAVSVPRPVAAAVGIAEDFSLGTSNYVLPREKGYAGSLNVQPLPDVHDVIAHGNATRVRVNGRLLNAEQLALEITNTGYTGGPVRLVSCFSGESVDGIAQQLANRLDQLVLGATSKVHPLQMGLCI
jgi:hypothetical protein